MVSTQQARRLVVVSDGALQGRTFSLTADRVVVGRGEDCALRIEDRYVSRIHALIERRDGWTVLSDLGSSGGTTVNGVPVAPGQQLRPGDVIGLGPVQLRFEQGDVHTTTPFVPAVNPSQPAPAPQAVSTFGIGSQQADVLNNVAHDQYVIQQQRESFLREIAATRTKATWLIVLGFLAYVVGGGIYAYAILKFGSDLSSASATDTAPPLFGDKVAGVPIGIWGFATAGIGTVLLMVGIVLRIVAAARKRRLDDRTLRTREFAPPAYPVQ